MKENTKPTRLDIAIENMKSKMKKVEMDITLLNKEREVLQNEIWALEKLRDDKNFEL